MPKKENVKLGFEVLEVIVMGEYSFILPTLKEREAKKA